MTRTRTAAFATALVLMLAGPARLALAQEQPAQPAPAAPPPPSAAPEVPAVDSNQLWVGEWDYTAQLRDSTVEGLWRINYANGRFTGTVTIPRQPPAPISSMSLRDHYRNMQFTVYFNSEPYVFSGRLDNLRNISGTLTIRGGIGRLRAQKRG